MFEKKAYRFLFWLISGIFIFLFIYLLTKLFPAYGVLFSFIWKVFAPFAVSGFIAYLLHPLIRKLAEWHIPKSLAILMVYVFIFGGIGYGAYRMYPVVVHELKEMNDQIPYFMNLYSDVVYQVYEYTSFLPETVHDKMDSLLGSMEKRLDRITGKLVGQLTKIVDMIVFITVIPVLVFYFLKDFDVIKDYMKQWIPRKYRGNADQLIAAIDEGLGKYLRGLFLVSLFVIGATFVVLYILGVKYALILAIVMGMTNIIPYFGPIIGAIPVVMITLAQSVKLALLSLVAIFTIQLVEGNLLSPYIFGKSVRIHPVAIIFALLVGGQLGGVVGMIIAVPLLTIGSVSIRRFRSFRTQDMA